MVAASETLLTFSFVLLIVATFLFFLSCGVVVRGLRLDLLGGLIFLLCLLFDGRIVDVSDAKKNSD